MMFKKICQPFTFNISEIAENQNQTKAKFCLGFAALYRREQ